MSPLRKVARDAAKGKSYKNAKNTNMFEYYFVKMWREKGHPRNINKYGYPSATKKNHKPRFAYVQVA